MWRIYLRSHSGEVTSKTITSDPVAAETAYRALLARDELIGDRVAAVISSTVAARTGGGVSIYFSRFDRDFGAGRIHPQAPLDLLRANDGTKDATAWTPPAEDGGHDWEADPRPFADAIKAWHARPGWTRDRAAAELRTPLTTYHGWCAGRGCALEGAIRRLMTLLDHRNRRNRNGRFQEGHGPAAESRDVPDMGIREKGR